MSYKIFLILITYYILNQINVKSVFIYEELNKKIYLNLSNSFQDQKNNMIYRLLKFLYNFKQALHVWVKVLREFLIKNLITVYIKKNFIIIIYKKLILWDACADECLLTSALMQTFTLITLLCQYYTCNKMLYWQL